MTLRKRVENMGRTIRSHDLEMFIEIIAPGDGYSTVFVDNGRNTICESFAFSSRSEALKSALKRAAMGIQLFD